jgi:hypothetical protein
MLFRYNLVVFLGLIDTFRFGGQGFSNAPCVPRVPDTPSRGDSQKRNELWLKPLHNPGSAKVSSTAPSTAPPHVYAEPLLSSLAASLAIRGG